MLPRPALAAPRARARAGPRDPRAVRRARHAGRADRGDREGRRHRPRADLPAVLLQGGAVRPDGHRLPRRARRRAARRRATTRRTRAPSSSAAARPTRLLPALPAFLDCALSLMRRPARELREIVSESVWLRLGQGMPRCVEHVADILRDGAGTGFAVEDPDYMANVLWTQMLGTCTSRASASASARPRPACRSCSRSSPTTSRGRASRARWRRSARSSAARAPRAGRGRAARLRARSGARRRPPRCGCARRAWRGSARRARSRSSRP